eukprot:GEZU01005219.1.p1 GENE.GEZU01005219.1~~GEZU01005219.1.p1  ORF type:complete len:234 (-),score=86.50 GEZU01005219.1:61-762(-)
MTAAADNVTNAAEFEFERASNNNLLPMPTSMQEVTTTTTRTTTGSLLEKKRSRSEITSDSDNHKCPSTTTVEPTVERVKQSPPPVFSETYNYSDDEGEDADDLNTVNQLLELNDEALSVLSDDASVPALLCEEAEQEYDDFEIESIFSNLTNQQQQQQQHLFDNFDNTALIDQIYYDLSLIQSDHPELPPQEEAGWGITKKRKMSHTFGVLEPFDEKALYFGDEDLYNFSAGS